ncbi:chromatin associated protein KTI12 [Necator americanus]|uniref:Protein KTI12 homolog n=1 Tax=Necator americanus TaxID=51031 RepID=W2TXI3_NECAM|nr:chromatin associated protein KTI12 [Necator americanus]ETN86765.1 chromatin associated protein KTI12 [Necator americanus]
MPLLVVTGHPSCGKSTIVQRIREYFTVEGKEVVIIGDDDDSLLSRDDYNNASKEKEHRSFLRSSVQKSLNQNTVVICDALNYIKARYEKPDQRNRWDSPLFDVNVGKSERNHTESVPDDMNVDLEHPSPKFVELPLSDIFKWLCEGTALVENQSTQNPPLAPINFLYELDRVTQDVVNAVMEGQRNTPVGHYIVISAHQPVENKAQIEGDDKKVPYSGSPDTIKATIHQHVQVKSDR